MHSAFKINFWPQIFVNFLGFHNVTLQVPGYENGNFVGPTILGSVTTNMECYKVSVKYTLHTHNLSMEEELMQR